VIDDNSKDSETISVEITSDTDNDGIIIDLEKVDDSVDTFTGSITFTETGTSSQTTLKVSTGDSITASFAGTNATSSIFSTSITFDKEGRDFGEIASITAIDQSANKDPSIFENIIVQVTSSADPNGISLTLKETGIDTGEFTGNVGLMIGNNIVESQSELVLCIYDQTSNTNSSAIENYEMDFWSTSDPAGFTFTIPETGTNTNTFDRNLAFSTNSSDITGTLNATSGDFYFFSEPGGDFPNVGMLTPNPDPSNGAIVVSTFKSVPQCSEEDIGNNLDPQSSTVIATYKSASDSLRVQDSDKGGGGGGGLVRPSLVVNALAGLGGAGGGSAYSSPSLQISNQVLLDWIDVPLEVEETVVNHDSTKPATAYDLGYFEDFDYPLIINDKGFILSGFTTTLETQTLNTNTPHTIKFLLYETEIIQHFSLYTNLRDATDEIHESDTQILYNANQELQVVDPNGFFESVSLVVNEIEDNKKEVVLEVTFAKEMDTSHIIVRSWDPNLFSGDTHILDAWEIISDVVVESPIPTYEEPEIQQLQSQTIPIWIKNNAAWWSEQQIGDSDFVEGIQYLIKNGIINVPGVKVTTDSNSLEIPEWIQNNAAWWAESLITDDDFIQAMQWLVANGVIQI
jgi:hypothetical protein